MNRIIIAGGMNDASLSSLLHMLDEAKREAFGESFDTVDLTEQDYEILDSKVRKEIQMEELEPIQKFYEGIYKK